MNKLKENCSFKTKAEKKQKSVFASKYRQMIARFEQCDQVLE